MKHLSFVLQLRAFITLMDDKLQPDTTGKKERKKKGMEGRKREGRGSGRRGQQLQQGGRSVLGGTMAAVEWAGGSGFLARPQEP